MAYTYALGARLAAHLVAPGLIGLVALSLLYAAFGV
jgi:hypothetical protein